VEEAFVDWLLAPALREGDILVMDNLSSHKNARVLEKIQATGAEVRFLPPYSPDLNPSNKSSPKSKHTYEEWLREPKENFKTQSKKPLES
jgi:transposase